MSNHTPAGSGTKESSKPIILVSYPKLIVLYPTYIAAILAGFFTLFLESSSPHHQTIGIVFLAVLGVNFVIFAFDFPRTTSLNLFFVGMIIVLSLFLISIYEPNLLPALTKILKMINPQANSTFYFCLAGILSALYVAMMINIRFDYWEVRPNELLHHHGFLSSLERYPAPNMRITKEIDDVFEYMLLRSGRLIIHPSNEPRAFILETVLNIDRQEDSITKMLGALQVQVRDPGSSNNSD